VEPYVVVVKRLFSKFWRSNSIGTLRMMLFTKTDKLQQAFAEALKYQTELSSTQRQAYEKAMASPAVALDLVTQLGSFLRQKFPNSNDYWMHTLLQSSQVYFPPKEERKKVRKVDEGWRHCSAHMATLAPQQPTWPPWHY